MNEPYRIKTITDLHQLAGVEGPNHPLVTLVRIEDVLTLGPQMPKSFIQEFYSVGFKKNLKGYIKYGRQTYDFQEGVLGFTSPHQLLSFEYSDASEATGWLLYFQEEFLAGSPLIKKIEEFGFFRYEVSEGLHLSKKEEELINGIFENIFEEYTQSIDRFSKDVLLSNLELLFTYSQRFYSRQFITRNQADSHFLDRFQEHLNRYFNSEKLANEGIPSVEYFAGQLNISSSYLSDMLKFLTGKTTKEHIHFKLIERAKERLLATDQTAAEIAYSIGFEYPQYFNRLFKEKTGMTPKEYRKGFVKVE